MSLVVVVWGHGARRGGRGRGRLTAGGILAGVVMVREDGNAADLAAAAVLPVLFHMPDEGGLDTRPAGKRPLDPTPSPFGNSRIRIRVHICPPLLPFHHPPSFFFCSTLTRSSRRAACTATGSASSFGSTRNLPPADGRGAPLPQTSSSSTRKRFVASTSAKMMYRS